MKIAYVCAYSKIAQGGDSRVAWELARYMAKNTEMEIWMICPEEEFLSRCDEIEPALHVQTVSATKMSEGVSIFSPTLPNVKELFNILDELNPDIVHSHNIDPLSFATQGWAIDRHIPFVYTGHVLATQFNSWNDFNNTTKAMESVIGISINAYTKVYYKNCSKIICLNNYAKNDFIKFTNAPSKMVVIPNGHEFMDTSKKKINLEKVDEYSLLFPGYINERKNQKFLIQMLKAINVKGDVTLYLAGNFMSNEYERIIKKEIRDLPGNRHVRLLGYVGHEELISLYNRMHYLVSAATAEVQSLSIIESLASGTPVIGLANTTTTELVTTGYNGEVLRVNASAKTFGEVVSRYLNKSNEEYLTLSKNCRESVKFLEYSNIARQYTDFYKLETKAGVTFSGEVSSLRTISKILKLDFLEIFKRKKVFGYGITFSLVSLIVVIGTPIVKAYMKLTGKKENS